jgi:SagB-type dehydrogenase family enzyme
VAGQDFFADAPVLCVLAPRFHRNFWKYRNHAKAYRVCVLDAGHLSQTLQLCATQVGLGPFVTGAINEIDIERAFGFTGYAESPLVVCGFGPRAGTLVTSEFDPSRKVWPRA